MAQVYTSASRAGNGFSGSALLSVPPWRNCLTPIVRVWESEALKNSARLFIFRENRVSEIRYILAMRCEMKFRSAIAFALLIAAAAICAPVFAHHGNSAY